METTKKACILVFALSALFQALNFASQGLAVKTYKDADAAAGNNTNMENNYGYYTFVLAASAISVVFYGILIVRNVSNDGPSSMLDWACSHLVIILQFGVATVLVTYFRNNAKTYESAMTLLDTYQAAGVTGSTVDTLLSYRNIHHITIAAVVIDYLICFGGGFFVLAWSESEKRNKQPQIKSDKENHQITVEAINPVR